MADRTKMRVANVFNELANAIETGDFSQRTRIGLTILGSEHGPDELTRGAKLAMERYPGIEVILIGTGVETELELIECASLAAAHQIMDNMLENKELDGAVTMHYNFPLGVSTVGRVQTPAKGREMFLATTTGTSATERVSSMVINTIYGIATAKALGLKVPTMGILNIEGARLVEKHLRKLVKEGYIINFAESARADGGVVMRGNDLLQGTPDIMVTDTLTGNLLMKMFSAYNTGGGYEVTGYGYGPGVGDNYDKLIAIISRASGAPVIANAIKFVSQVHQGHLQEKLAVEMKQAKKAGLEDILDKIQKEYGTKANEEIEAPIAKIVEKDIPGIDILDIEAAKNTLWKSDIYAETGMGCTGPVILIAKEDLAKARSILIKEGYVS